MYPNSRLFSRIFSMKTIVVENGSLLGKLIQESQYLKKFIIVDLQCIVSAVQQSDSVIHKHTFFFSHYPPQLSITSDWVQFPVLYSRISLLIHSKCNSLHLLTPNSLSILLSLSPLATTSLLSKSMSLFIFSRWVHLCLILEGITIFN